MIKKESYFELKKEREMICSDLDLFRINTFHVLNISEKIEKSKIVSDIIKKIKKFKELAEKDIEEIENEKTMEERFSKAKKQIYDYYFSPSFSGKFDDKTGDFHLLVDGFPIDHLVNKKEKVAKEIIKEQKGRISVILEKEDEEYNEKKKLLSFSFSLSFLYETVIEVGKRKGKEKREIRDSITVNPSAIDSDYDSDFLDIDLLDEFDEEEGIFQELKEKVCTSRHEYKKKIKKIEKLWEKLVKESDEKLKKKLEKEIEKLTSEVTEKILKDPLFEKEIIKLKKITIEERLFKEKKRRREKYKGKEKDIQKKIGESIWESFQEIIRNYGVISILAAGKWEKNLAKKTRSFFGNRLVELTELKESLEGTTKEEVLNELKETKSDEEIVKITKESMETMVKERVSNKLKKSEAWKKISNTPLVERKEVLEETIDSLEQEIKLLIKGDEKNEIDFEEKKIYFEQGKISLQEEKRKLEEDDGGGKFFGLYEVVDAFQEEAEKIIRHELKGTLVTENFRIFLITYLVFLAGKVRENYTNENYDKYKLFNNIKLGSFPKFHDWVKEMERKKFFLERKLSQIDTKLYEKITSDLDGILEEKEKIFLEEQKENVIRWVGFLDDKEKEDIKKIETKEELKEYLENLFNTKKNELVKNLESSWWCYEKNEIQTIKDIEDVKKIEREYELITKFKVFKLDTKRHKIGWSLTILFLISTSFSIYKLKLWNKFWTWYYSFGRTIVWENLVD